MAWTKTSEGKDKGYAVYSEDIPGVVLATGVSDNNFSSVIDFIPPGTDFTVIANSASLNLSASTGVQLFVGYDKNAPNPVKDVTLYRYQVVETPFVSDTSQIDAAAKVLYRDVSAKGQYPYYWLKMPGGGGNGTGINFKIIVGKNQESAI